MNRWRSNEIRNCVKFWSPCALAPETKKAVRKSPRSEKAFHKLIHSKSNKPPRQQIKTDRSGQNRIETNNEYE